MVEDTCDDCGATILVVGAAYNERTQLAFCQECMSETPSTKPCSEDVTNHVVGFKI